MDPMMIETPHTMHMWVTLAIIGGAVLFYVQDRIPLELTSIVLLSVLLLFFYFFPLLNANEEVILDTEALLMGFANPALIAVIALLVLGQSVVQTGALNEVANWIVKFSRQNAFVAVLLCLFVVTVVSAILNNTPVVVIFIPILSALAKNLDMSVSKLMIPLSFAAIMGGMMTLIGSSTNLLVSGTIQNMGFAPISMFDFTIPGIVLATVGFVFTVIVVPKLLPDRASMSRSFVGDDERLFVAQVELDPQSELVGKIIEEGNLPGFKDIAIRMIQRSEHAFLPPFDEEMMLRSHDILVVAATRKDLTELLSKQPDSLLQQKAEGINEEDEEEEIAADVSMAEVVVTPTSRMIGRNLEQIAFHHQHECVVLGIQRRSRIIRARVTEIRLQAGDVLLVMGKRDNVITLQESPDVLLLEWSTEEIHSGKKAVRAAIIFFAVVGTAAFNIVPITVSAFVGATATILTGCLNLRQAGRVLDVQIILMIATALALGAALDATGGAGFLADMLIFAMQGASPPVIMSALFLLMVGMTNVLSNNASAVLFTPIAVNTATHLQVQPDMFIYAVIFACNCSFITPIGYQTNLLVMGPGHHKFVDFIRSGVPLALLIWITYSLFAPWYFGY